MRDHRSARARSRRRSRDSAWRRCGRRDDGKPARARPDRGAAQRCREAGKPFLGICIGIQVLFDRSDEDDGANCLGIVPGRVSRFPRRSTGVRSRCRRSDGTACTRRGRIRCSPACPTTPISISSIQLLSGRRTILRGDRRLRLWRAVHRGDRARQRHRNAVPSRKKRRGRPRMLDNFCRMKF